jgi:hypothetical protein
MEPSRSRRARIKHMILAQACALFLFLTMNYMLAAV